MAIDVVRSGLRCGASAADMYCLEARDQMPATPAEIAEAEEDGATVHCGWGPKEILTRDGKAVAVVFKRCVSVYDAEGRFAPTYDDNDTVTVECDHVFLSIGQSIQWGSLLEAPGWSWAVAAVPWPTR